jgi:hypothetical protein
MARHSEEDLRRKVMREVESWLIMEDIVIFGDVKKPARGQMV